eukprot:gene1661-1029_t
MHNVCVCFTTTTSAPGIGGLPTSQRIGGDLVYLTGSETGSHQIFIRYHQNLSREKKEKKRKPLYIVVYIQATKSQQFSLPSLTRLFFLCFVSVPVKKKPTTTQKDKKKGWRLSLSPPSAFTQQPPSPFTHTQRTANSNWTIAHCFPPDTPSYDHFQLLLSGSQSRAERETN